MAVLDATPGNADASLLPGELVDWRSGPPLPVGRATTVPELIAQCRDRFAAECVIRDGERTATWRDLDAWSARVAAAWAAQLPVGSRCAILVPNGLPHLIAELACWRLGALAAPIFLGFGAERTAALLASLEPQLVLVDEMSLRCVVPAKVPCQTSTELWQHAQYVGAGSRDRLIRGTDPCLIQFTSGSTGVSRGVVLTHDNLASQQAAFALHWPEVGPGDRLAAYLPWHHSFGALAERLWSLCRGAELTVVPGGGRDRQKLLTTIRAVRPTVFLSVPKVHALVVEERLFTHGDLRWVFTAGAPMPCNLRDWYADADVPLCEGWGLTEASPSCTLTRPGRGITGVVGQPIAGIDVGVRRRDGRIMVRGPNVMAGYLRQQSLALCAGVLDTGDLGAWSDDGLCLRGRADHQLKLGNGEKVCAAEIEAALLAHRAILHAVVAAEPDLLVIVDVRDGSHSGEVRSAVDAVNAAQVVPYHRIGAIHVVARRMCTENGQLTASLKVSRGHVLDAFRRWRQSGGADFITVRA